MIILAPGNATSLQEEERNAVFYLFIFNNEKFLILLKSGFGLPLFIPKFSPFFFPPFLSIMAYESVLASKTCISLSLVQFNFVFNDLSSYLLILCKSITKHCH